jgi:hypothetical protein
MEDQEMKDFGFVSLVMLIAIYGTALAGTYSGGSGEPDDPYIIATATDLDEMRVYPDDWAKQFVVAADIDMNELDYSTAVVAHNGQHFTGSFDGNDMVIRNISINNGGTQKADFGLFGVVGESAVVKGVIIENISITMGNAPKNIGSMIGTNYGDVRNCRIQGDVTIVVGDAIPTGSGYAAENVGGLVGSNYGNVKSCEILGEVTIVGGNAVSHEYHGGGSCAGCGEHWHDVKHFGGLVGYNYKNGTVANCSVEGPCSISGGSYSERLGGMIGSNSGTIQDCYVVGATITGHKYIGGLAGLSSSRAKIINCYAICPVTGKNNLGGLVGSASSDSVTKSYYLAQADGGGPDNSLGTGLTDEQFRRAGSFIDWSFYGSSENGVWAIWDGHTYPKFSWQISGYPGKGNGTKSDPYLVSNPDEMQVIGTYSTFFSKHYRLMSHLDMLNTPINAIGHNTVPFTGTFDGGGHVISKFTYESSGQDNIGLFGYVDDPNALIHRLGLEDVDIDANDGNYVGSIVGRLNSGSIEECYSSIACETCFATVKSSSGNYVGSIAGYSNGSIVDCYNYGTTVEAANYGGGLVGGNGDDGTIHQCYSNGFVTSLSNPGGLVADGNDPNNNVTFSFWDRDETISGQSTSPGGGTGVAHSQMDNKTTFTGWDFIGDVYGTWTILDNHTPTLTWEHKSEIDVIFPPYGNYGVDFQDFSYFAEHWAEDDCLLTSDCYGADLDQSGTVDFKDYAMFAQEFLE